MASLGTRKWLGPVPRPAHRPRKEWWGPWEPLPGFVDYARHISPANIPLLVVDFLSEPDPILDGIPWGSA